MAIYVNGNTKKGQRLIAMGTRYEGIVLDQVYDRYSDKKAMAWADCYDEYMASEKHDAFSICSHNSQAFTVSWLCTIDNENALVIRTYRNRYIVWLDR